MPNILYFIIASCIWYVALTYFIEKKKLNAISKNTYTGFPISVLLLTVFSFAKIFLNIQGWALNVVNSYPDVLRITTIVISYLLLAFSVPIYILTMQNKIQISNSINKKIAFLDIFLFINVIIRCGIQSLIFPAIYLLCEFVFSNKLQALKNKKITLHISYMDFYRSLQGDDKPKYKELLFKSLTVFFFMMTFTMIASKKFGIFYTGFFIIAISFMLVKNIRDEKIKSAFNKK
ncbi:MAG: hypothetical protein LBU68_00300 [Rickettsiales bacterium]|jgi:hypothetical protein|nr:hypothetical protein [Rickettsiales bacterium]